MNVVRMEEYMTSIKEVLYVGLDIRRGYPRRDRVLTSLCERLIKKVERTCIFTQKMPIHSYWRDKLFYFIGV